MEKSLEKPLFSKMTVYFKHEKIVKFTYRGDQTQDILKRNGKPLETEIEALAYKLASVQNNSASVILYDELGNIQFIKMRDDVILDKIDFQKSVDAYGSTIGGGSDDSTSASTITDINS